MIELIAAVVGALAGATATEAGHLWRERRARAREQELAAAEAIHLEQRQLDELLHLLNRTRQLFVEQASKRDELAARLRRGTLTFRPSRPGYEYLFAELYPEMTPEERTLHQMVAGFTEEALDPANRQLQSWLMLMAARELRTRYAKEPEHHDVAHQLDLLEQHLDGWFVKYRRVFSANPARALVWLADEDKLGPGFPRRLESGCQGLIVKPFLRVDFWPW